MKESGKRRWWALGAMSLAILACPSGRRAHRGLPAEDERPERDDASPHREGG